MVKNHWFFAPMFLIISNFIVPCIGISVDHTNELISYNSPHSTLKAASTTLSVLVVLMDLPDDPHHPTHTTNHYENLFFSTGTNSVRQYYQNTSYGEVTLVGDILGWFQAKNNLSYYGAGTRLPYGNQDTRSYELVAEAQNYSIETGKDPQNYDLFTIIHSGDGQEYSGNSNDIWSHKGNYPVDYSMNHEYIDYVTSSHELGHELNFPDLYDLQFEHIFAGPYCLMAQGRGHFSIWNKYYSKVSRSDSAQFISNAHRLQISDFSNDTIVTVNPIAMTEPNGIMWLELGWNPSGFANSEHGRGWTVTVRENLDFDRYLPNHGFIIAEIQVGLRTSNQIQVPSYVSPPWNVIDAHPETKENKDDAPFSLAEGGIGTYCSGEGWAVQLIETNENLSYQFRVTNENNIPHVAIVEPNRSIAKTYDIQILVNSAESSDISLTEVSVDNGPWQTCTSINSSEGMYSYNWNTIEEREGTHLVRARALDKTSIAYIGYSSFKSFEVDNTKGTILVVDDDLGRTSEISILNALDELGLKNEYEIKRTTSLTETEITAEEMMAYEYVIWVGNPSITPISNSHINYNEFKEIKKFLESSTKDNPSNIIFLSNYNIFDFSNQGDDVHNEIDNIFHAQSPTNFRAPVDLLKGRQFLENIPPFTLGPTDTLFGNQSSDGEVVTLLPGAIPILEDEDPEFPGFGTKGYCVVNEDSALINFLFQPESVPSVILPQLLNLSLNFLAQSDKPTFTTFSESKSSTILSRTSSSTTGMDPLIFFWTLITGIIVYIKRRK